MGKSLFLFLPIWLGGVNGVLELAARTLTMTEVAAAASAIGLQEGDVVTISSQGELLSFASFANERNYSTASDVYGELLGIIYRLEADIDLAGKAWSVVGTAYDTPFNGTFDGQGHTISNLSVSGKADNAGMFGYVGDNNKTGCVKNLCLDNININNTKSGQYTSTAGLVGFLIDSEIENCRVSGKIYGTGIAGGLVGCAVRGRIKNCYNTATVEIHSSGTCAGGIVGQMTGTNISCSYNGGNVAYRGFAYGTQGIGSLCGESPAVETAISQTFFLNTTAASAYPAISEQKNALYSRTADQFASGQVACELSLENPGAWGQWLAPGAYQDSFPVFYNVEKHPEVVADQNNAGGFINDGFPVVYYSSIEPSGDNIFYGRRQWYDAVCARLSTHPNELAFADATWEELVAGLETPDAVPEVNNLLCRTADASGWTAGRLLVTDLHPFNTPYSFTAKQVIYNRQLYKDGGYESWYFPLDVSVSQIPDGYTFELYDGPDVGSDAISFASLSADVAELSGDTPYLLKYVGAEPCQTPSTVEIRWENVTWPASGVLRNVDVVTETGFYGTLAGQTAPEANAHLYTIAVNGQSFSTLAAGKTLKPFRCYFYHAGTGAARIAVLHRDMTSVATVTDSRRNPADVPACDLQGRSVAGKSPSGLFIRDGKTIFKK